ncbi:MAG: SRPBCC family protein [Pyrinomonadaceae bacterium]
MQGQALPPQILMPVYNVHERLIQASVGAAGELLDNLASPDDRLWPSDRWPAIRFDRPLMLGAKGGHGPIRYFVEAYTPGRSIRFRFTAPRGFDGTHSFEVEEVRAGVVRLRHTLRMNVRGPARLSWPLAFRWLHDALIEDALDRAEAQLGGGAYARQQKWSWRVRVLRQAAASLL